MTLPLTIIFVRITAFFLDLLLLFNLIFHFLTIISQLYRILLSYFIKRFLSLFVVCEVYVDCQKLFL